MGRWSRLVAREFLAWLAVSPDSAWLDVGCGTGALMQGILDVEAPRSVVGIDPSEGYIGYAREHVRYDRVRFEVGDAHNLPFEAATFDAVVSGLVLNFVPEPARAVAEMKRVARPGGTVAAYVWDYAGKMELMRYFWDAANTGRHSQHGQAPRLVTGRAQVLAGVRSRPRGGTLADWVRPARGLPATSALLQTEHAHERSTLSAPLRGSGPARHVPAHRGAGRAGRRRPY